jgi:hypothetical protein
LDKPDVHHGGSSNGKHAKSRKGIAERTKRRGWLKFVTTKLLPILRSSTGPIGSRNQHLIPREKLIIIRRTSASLARHAGSLPTGSFIPSSSSPCAPPCPRIHSFLIQILRDMLPQCSAAAHITRGHAPPALSTSVRQINKRRPTRASLSAVASRLTAERQPGTADATYA